MIEFSEAEAARLPVYPQVYAQFLACLLKKRYTPQGLFEMRPAPCGCEEREERHV